MQPIKNQGQCGSCWAFATVALVEFNYCVKHNSTPVSLSEQQLVDCSTNNYGCNGGYQDAALYDISIIGGLDSTASYPYTSGSGTSGTCKFNAANVKAKVSATNPITYINQGDTATMMSVLANKQLVTVDIAVVSSFMSYSSGVYVEPNCKTNILGYHAITVVGYGTSTTGINYWVKN